MIPTVCSVVHWIVGNLLTLVVLACQRLRAGAAAERKVNVWLQALAVSDLLLCVTLLPHGLMTYGERLVYTSLSFQLLYQAYGAAVINNLNNNRVSRPVYHHEVFHQHLHRERTHLHELLSVLSMPLLRSSTTSY